MLDQLRVFLLAAIGAFVVCTAVVSSTEGVQEALPQIRAARPVTSLLSEDDVEPPGETSQLWSANMDIGDVKTGESVSESLKVHESLMNVTSKDRDGIEEIEKNAHLCRMHTALYLQELRKFTLWAATMYDSTAKTPEGILSGNVFQFGSYDSCVELRVPLASSGITENVGTNEGTTLGDTTGELLLQGKYCLASVRVAPLPDVYPDFYSTPEDPFRMTFDPNGSAWEKIRPSEDKRRASRDVVHMGVCVPSSCSADMVGRALAEALQPLEQQYGVQTNVELAETMCRTNSVRSLTSGDIVYTVVVGVIILIVLSCTAHEVLVYARRPKNEIHGMTSTLVRAFSLRSNWLSLMKAPAEREDDLSCIHGLRFFSMVLIILGHRCMFSFGGPLHNPEYIEEIYTSAKNMMLLNGPIIVDTFFVISGFLVCYLLLNELDKRKSINLPVLYLYRYIRLTPVYMVVIMFYTTLLDLLGTGPMWQAKVGLEKARCQESWWTNLIYVNNYVNTEHLCLFQSWYLACDMHYFLLAPLIVYPLWRWPRFGRVLLGVSTVMAVFSPSVVTFLRDLDAVLLLYMSTLSDPVANATFRSIYIPSHSRSGPYFLGMVWGYVFYRIKTGGVKMPKSASSFVSVLLHGVALASLFGAWAFYVPGEQHSGLEKALYAGLHRAGWGISMGWLIIACSLDLAGPYRALFSWRPVVPLSRLTYCAFLVHSGVQLVQASTARTPEYMSYYKLFWMTAGDVTVTFTLALVLHMLFEAPVCALQKALLKRDQDNKNSNNETTLPTHVTASSANTERWSPR